MDLNTASAPLLTRVSGIGEGLAENIVAHRDANGPFRTADGAARACRGWARRRSSSAPASCGSAGGDDPLDASCVHPEAYPVVRRIVAATDGRHARR